MSFFFFEIELGCIVVIPVLPIEPSFPKVGQGRPTIVESFQILRGGDIGM